MNKKRIFVLYSVILLLFCSCAKPASRTQSDIPVLTPANTAATTNIRTDEPADPRTCEPATPSPSPEPVYDIEILNTYAYDESVKQILTVIPSSGYNADVTLYVKKDGIWKDILHTEGVIGKNGIGKTAEGDKKTPAGDYAITGAFGICENPGTALPYIKVTDTTYACSDDCEYYNQIIDTAETGHTCHGEKMISYAPQYNYGLIVGYNSENIYPLGSAIFVHCSGKYSYTNGCVTVSEADMVTIVKAAEPGMRIYIGR